MRFSVAAVSLMISTCSFADGDNCVVGAYCIDGASTRDSVQSACRLQAHSTTMNRNGYGDLVTYETGTLVDHDLLVAGGGPILGETGVACPDQSFRIECVVKDPARELGVHDCVGINQSDVAP